MEMLVSVIMGLIGAAATIYAAKIQNERKEAQHLADEAKFATTLKSGSPANIGAQQLDSQQVQGTLIFPGSSSFQDSGRRSYGYISVHLDADQIGSGPGDRGFKMDFVTTVGLHDLVFMWDVDREGFSYEGRHYEARTSQQRSHLEVVFQRPGPCILRLGYSSGFNVRRFEPLGSGYVPVAARSVTYMFIVGLGLIVVSGLVLWSLFKR